MSGDLIAWLRGVLDKRERVAVAADAGSPQGSWHVSHDVVPVLIRDADGSPVVYDEGSPTDEQALHIAWNDPAAEVADAVADEEASRLAG